MALSLINELIKLLAEIEVESPRLEAKIIYEDLNLGDVLSDEQKDIIEDILKRRKNKEPLDKIMGYKGFYKANFVVDQNVLSPRPDTELLLEETLALLKNGDSILELGVGSGCVIISALMECAGTKGVGIDKSSKALEVAAKNAVIMGVADRIKLQELDYFAEINFDEKFDIVISNPPYIPTMDVEELEEEVKNFDPLMALDGGEDGLDHYRLIAKISPQFLNNNAHLLLEVGIGQAADVRDIFEASGFELLKLSQDLGGIERCLIFCLKA